MEGSPSLQLRQKRARKRGLPALLASLVFSALLVVAAAPASAAAGDTIRASLTSTGAQIGAWSETTPSGRTISADGSRIVFESTGQLLPTDDTGSPDIYVRDIEGDTLERASVSPTGGNTSGYSVDPVISSDGRFVAFTSFAQLVVGDTNSERDVYVRDLQTDTTLWASVGLGGTSPNGPAYAPGISASGRYVSFLSSASNLLSPGLDTNGGGDIFIRDLVAGTTEIVSIRTDGTQVGGGPGGSTAVSGNGRFVAFEHTGPLDVQDGNARSDIYIRDRTTPSTIRMSEALGGGDAAEGSTGVAMSDDGSVVAFGSCSDDLVANDANGKCDIFARQIGGPTQLASVNTSGFAGIDHSEYAAISPDGRFVAFSSSSPDVVAGDGNGLLDVFLRDLQGSTRLVSLTASGGQANSSSFYPAVADDGAYVAFTSNASNLVTSDTNGERDVFRHEVDLAVPRFSLQTVKSGSGAGSVTSSPAGIDCGMTCSADFDEGEVVTLSAVPALGSSFAGWSGAGCSGTATCVVSTDAARSVTATFDNLPQLTTRFSDDFDGAALDSAKWNTTIATSGVRWCATTQSGNHLTVSGLWQDVSSQACHGLFAASPHGSITVGGGSATFSAATRRTFPYIWRGSPSGTSPFPATGAFVLEVTMAFDSLAPHGTEFHVGDWPNSDPVGDNPPGNLVFAIGACSGCGLVTNLLGVATVVPGDPTDLHDYRLEYVNGAYSLWVDGVRTMGPVASSTRPNAMWMGNPVFTHWASAGLDRFHDRLRAGQGARLISPGCGQDRQQWGHRHLHPRGDRLWPDVLRELRRRDPGHALSRRERELDVHRLERSGMLRHRRLRRHHGPSSLGHSYVHEEHIPTQPEPDRHGDGTVTSTPAGIDCGPTCSASFDAGTSVTLTAVPEVGTVFQGWSGDCAGAGTCILSMTSARSATATFTALPVDPAWGWGLNHFSQAGNNTCSPCTTPVQVSGLTNVVAISAGAYHSLALRSDGSVWGWGYNNDGEAGNNTCSPCTTPVQVSGLTNVVAISAGAYHSLALRSDGSVWGWGYNAYGQAGNNTCSPCTTPVQVSGLTNVVAISAGGWHSLALRSDGSAWGWGLNQVSQAGNNTCSPCTTPVQVSGLTNVVAISAGGYHSLALRSDRSVWGWGSDGSGQLGNTTCSAHCATPLQVSGLTNVDAITTGWAHSLALRSDGTVLGWGYNVYGQVGTSSCSPCTSPVQVSGLTNVDAISAGLYHSLAILSDGTARGWGVNHDGQVGNTACSPTCSAPLPVLGLSGIVAVSGGWYHSLAIASTFTPVGGETVTVSVAPGDPPVTTDAEGDGATPDDPVETQVSSPNGGTVTIEDGPSENISSPGIELLRRTDEHHRATCHAGRTADPGVPTGRLEDPVGPDGADTRGLQKRRVHAAPWPARIPPAPRTRSMRVPSRDPSRRRRADHRPDLRRQRVEPRLRGPPR